MPEELSPDSISSRSQLDPATLAAWQQAAELKDRDVFDVNGQRLGRLTRALAEDGSIIRFDVSLTPNARSLFHAPSDVAGIPPDAIARVEEDGVHLMQAAEQILHPENPVPAHAERDLRGAQDLPRKNR